ncbi:hypothetical protein HS961_06135 [Comamonas piscis]|uniref:NACHT domain-containing protein n=1 Tax=Comamonas piscis TaxID=1562974 RepID=A0A7G5EEM3_9BURK|nr:hypothetical protein [Comamonas piscis]QMV72448.1 hypothetical protein HS961_06135 [Comamonas piscis]WSO35216.1 hypothetical protein VUJ63_06160 [Comamonas piscis]
MRSAITSDYEQNLEVIKSGLLSLKATGADGFEGLLRIVLTGLTEIPFRLSASGLQGGMDGDAAISSDHVCFEAKRYSGEIHRNEVLTKLADLARKKEAADRLWILGATTEINTQLAKAVEEDGDKNAISTLILDWTSAPLPLLAIAVVSAGDEAIDFIANNFDAKTNQNKLSASDLKLAFLSISSHPEFENLLQRLKSNFNVSKMALKRAVDLNIEWRKKTFGSTRHARERLGQGLAVLQNKTFPSMRDELRGQILDELNACKEVILLGDEGHGKSWLSAQLCSDATGLGLFVSAEQLDGVSVNDLDDFLIDLLIKQTGEVANDTIKLRWRHRFEAWRVNPPLANLLIVVDGLNQRQNFRWDRLLNGIQSRLADIGGRMVVTVRPHFWQKEIARGLAFNPKIIAVPEWLPQERDELLTHYGISLDWLDKKTLQTLRNPRLLAVAIATLPHHEATTWKGLTTDRLLMEHLRTSQLENYEGETFVRLTKRLSEHATKVLERVKASSDEPSKYFQANSAAVIETRFFRPLAGPGDLYELRDEGLTLALGFTLVDQLWQTHSAKRDLTVRVTQLVEPINAMDRTADVIFASLLICALDDSRFDAGIFLALLDAFANLQNVNDQRFEEFVEIVKHQPEALFDILKVFCLETRLRINHDWFIHAAFVVASTDAGWYAAKAAIRHWLHCYNKDPVAQIRRYHKQSDADYVGQIEKKKAEIEEELESLSAFEEQLLKQMTEVSSEPDELFTLALRLLAGRSLVGFADTFVSMGVAFTLSKNLHSSRKAFQQLTTFNRVDRTATRSAFRKAIEPLRTKASSRGGQWTVVRMLYASGEECDAVEASALAEELRKGCNHFWSPSPVEWRQAKVANPDAIRPVDLDKGLQEFNVLDPDNILQSMGFGREDHGFRDFLPVACRFEPVAAFVKTKSIIGGLLTREGFPLRQVILNCDPHLPLVDPQLAKNLIKRVMNSNAFETLPENDRSICRMFAFYYSAGQISAGEQLRCMTGKDLGPDYLLSVIPSLKSQATEDIIAAVRGAINRNDEDAANGALVAALYGQTQINSELEDLILKCSQGTSSKLRAIAYQLATLRGLDSVRQAHTSSNWSAAIADGNTYEEWFGSMLLVEACAQDEILVDNILKRISQKTWFASTERLGISFTEPLVHFFIQRLRRGVTAVQEMQLPPVDFELSRTGPAPFSFLSIQETDRDSERFPKQRSLKEIFGSDDDFDEKQKKLHAMANSFFAEIKHSEARLLVQEFTIDNLRRLVSEVPLLLNELVEILEQAENAQFIWLKNLAFSVANLISAQSPDHAVELLKRASTSKGFVTQSLEDSLTLEHQAIWGSEVSEPIEAMWRQRIMGSENDEILAREILAAERFGAADFIKSIVLQLALSEDGLDQIYAITIAGYSIQSDIFVKTIREHEGDKGLTGQAAKHALIEHENAIWTQHWVDHMWNAPTAQEFWRCLMIAKTSMDARVSNKTPESSCWALYAPVFQRVRASAIKDRNKERKKRLLGQETPESIFIKFSK